jgi:exodeoxyribonuclease-3
LHGIASILLELNADILVLTEFRQPSGKLLLEWLQPLGYHCLDAVETPRQNGGCLLSRWPLELFASDPCPMHAHRWIEARVPSQDLSVLALHVPNEGERWNKAEFWHCLERYAERNLNHRALIMGDFNTALDADAQGQKIKTAANLQGLLDQGWCDAWRSRHPEAREYTWFSPNVGNGFRLDHCLLSPALAPALRDSKLHHEVRQAGLSDHSLLVVELEMH